MKSSPKNVVFVGFQGFWCPVSAPLIKTFSKYDFWNLWKIWDRNRYSKKMLEKKIVEKNPKTFCQKIGTKNRFFIGKKSMKIRNFEISKF